VPENVKFAVTGPWVITTMLVVAVPFSRGREVGMLKNVGEVVSASVGPLALVSVINRVLLDGEGLLSGV
jgi:hypothetical protein